MQESKNNTLLFESKDIAVASFLMSCDGLKLVEKERLNGNVIFRFSPFDKASQLERSYWNLDAPFIQPKKLFSSLRDIKDMIFSGNSNESRNKGSTVQIV